MRCLLLLCLLMPTGAWATELMPWFGNDKEFEWRGSYRYQHYSKAHSVLGRRDRDASESFLGTSLAISPTPSWAGEVEFYVGKTSAHDNPEVQAGIATLRYNWCNDIIGDPFSLTTGVTVYFPTSFAQRDIGSYYHEDYDIEVHMAIGKETPYGRSWADRYWVILAGGIPIQEDPWARLHFAYELNCCDCHHYRVFFEGGTGFGNDKLDLDMHFDGYGPIDYMYMAAGFRYTRVLLYQGAISAEITQRVFSQHSSYNNLSLLVTYLHTFGL